MKLILKDLKPQKRLLKNKKMKKEKIRGIIDYWTRESNFSLGGELTEAIMNVLFEEKEKLIHDHEILINTIVDTKNREIKKLKGRGN